MVQEVFSEHKLPADFGLRVIVDRSEMLQLYDARFKGMSDPESEEDLLIPVQPKAGPAHPA